MSFFMGKINHKKIFVHKLATEFERVHKIIKLGFCVTVVFKVKFYFSMYDIHEKHKTRK